MFATIYLPDFYLQAALRHQPELRAKPVALIDDQEKKAVIIQLNPAAEQTGVRSGMTPSQGLARCLQLVIKVRALSQEDLLRGILLRFAGTLAPYVEETGPGLSTVQFTDARNLGTKVARVIEQLADFEIVAQAGIAPTPDASFLAAHLAKPVLQIENASEFLAALPIETLSIG
ncbi:MAG: polymerase [Verrucomicrobiota bacterium]|jgi:nucleotidyltransferase/DNA polymerase involved in DNA repair